MANERTGYTDLTNKRPALSLFREDDGQMRTRDLTQQIYARRQQYFEEQIVTLLARIT